MPRHELLSQSDLDAALSSLPGWSIAGAKLRKEFRFPDFTHAFGFMATAATAIEKMDHHPEWCNVYNRVTVELTTHDAGGITQADIKLAGLLDKFAQKLS
ncbi:MAG TPA: 4a-hydroxytetrahydrobiopterin dehydratase [Bryobacteraceae bacterium]|jgi:4a-hydroxytetrahydrobiopterin dehydratase|nr:4a-hydroxytetrahydrobiopterin dehydratase [Bryobacteraceae bacterium]